MPQNDLVQIIVSGMVGAGGLAGASALYKAFTERKKVPADINLTILGGAEKALLMMKSQLDDAEKRILSLRTEIAEMRSQFHQEQAEQRERHRLELEAKNREMRELQEDLNQLQEQFNRLAAQLRRIQEEASNDDNRQQT